MLHRRTDNIEQRAVDIANREAEKIYKEMGSFERHQIVWKNTYEEAFKELSSK